MFPTDQLPILIELAFGQKAIPPTQWAWTDVRAELPTRIPSQRFNAARGRADESSVAAPSSLPVVFDNIDGNLSPHNPNSVYWPNVRRGVPLRASVDAGSPALLLSGNGSVSTPDHADFDVTDVDARILIQPHAWAHAVDWTLANGARSLSDTRARLFSKWNATGDQRSWGLSLWAAGWPLGEWSTDGTAGASTLEWSEQLVAALRPLWLALVIDVDAGDTDHTMTIYRWDDHPDTAPADVTTWDVVDSWAYTGSTSSIHGGTADVMLGGIAGEQSFIGRILKYEQRSTVNGTLIADPDFTAATIGAPTVTDSTGKVWTLAGDAEISNRRPRYVGTIDDWQGPEWPHGDNEAGNPLRNSESRVSATASGILRRLGTGKRSKPLRSALYRRIRSAKVAANVVAYWPCEDPKAAVRLAGGTPTVTPATVEGADLGSNGSLLASAALPTVGSDDVSTWLGRIPAGAGSNDHWVVEWYWRLETPEANPVFTRLIAVTAAGDLAEWRISINDTNLLLEILDPLGAEIASIPFAGNPAFFDGWNLGRLEVSQDGADVDWYLSNTIIDTGIAAGSGATISSATMGRIATVGNIITGPPGGYSWGHVVVTDGNQGSGWLLGADTAWVGESAAHRFWRLCDEEGIPCEIIGDPSVYAETRGDLQYSEAMGPQEQKTLIQLLRDVALLDMGMIIERRGLPGLIYRCRHTLEAQSVALALDAARNARGDIITPLEPHLDDANLLNDVTFGSKHGSSAQFIDQDHIDAEDLYDTEQTDMAGVGGVRVQEGILIVQGGLRDAVEHQNLHQAAWRVHLGTWPALRWPTVTIDLGIAAVYYPDILDAWLDLELGDRVTLINLPAQYPDELLEFIVDHVTESMTPGTWQPKLTCSPGGPWQVGVLT